MFKKLSELKQGDSGIIRSFENEELSIKLLEMGCIPGEKIIIEQIAPLKDPISVLVGGYKLSLRIDEAESITVEQNIQY
jgi:ferrous iron transport protein A